MATLVILAILTFFSAIGVKGWESIVYPTGSSTPSDSPLPMALANVVGQHNFYYHLLITIGLFGLVASFHGIILVAGRATFEFGRIGYAPAIFGTTLKKRKTPAAALILNMFIGFLALLTGHTGEIITISVLGALTMYILSLASLFRLRQQEPSLHRPFKTPFYPWVPLVSLMLALVCFFSMVVINKLLTLIYLGLIAGGYAWYFLAIPEEVKRDLRKSSESVKTETSH
jgi:ethanolamine permease